MAALDELVEHRQREARVAGRDGVDQLRQNLIVNNAEDRLGRRRIDRTIARRRQLVERRDRIAKRAARVPRNQAQRVIVGLDALSVTNPPQRLEQLVGRRAQERKRLAATTHRVGQAVRLGRAENEDHVRRRLLQRLQERVGRVGRQRMGLVEDVDAIATQHGLLVDAIANVADVIDATIRGRIELEDIKRSAISNRETRLALETRRRRRTLRVLTIKRLAEDLRQRRLARATRPSKQVGMPHTVVINRIRQRLDNVALTHNMGKIQRAITTIKRGHGVSLPATRGREARGG